VVKKYNSIPSKFDIADKNRDRKMGCAPSVRARPGTASSVSGASIASIASIASTSQTTQLPSTRGSTDSRGTDRSDSPDGTCRWSPSVKSFETVSVLSPASFSGSDSTASQLFDPGSATSIQSGGVNQGLSNAVEKVGRPVRYQRSWVEAVVPADSVAVYQTYIANAPKENSGLTLMWHGVDPEWEDQQFLEMIDGFGLDAVDFVYLPLKFWIRNKDMDRTEKAKKGTLLRRPPSTASTKLKNKSYGFVHISDANKEAEFARNVAMLSLKLGRVMHTTGASVQGVTQQLMQTLLLSKARSAARGMVYVRINGELKPVSRYSLWKIHRISEDLNADLLTAPSES
jgi:hypothetical protein